MTCKNWSLNKSINLDYGESVWEVNKGYRNSFSIFFSGFRI